MYKPAFSSIDNFLRSVLFIALSFLVASCASEKPIRQDKAEIAILMPLSGPNGNEGKKLAELIKLGVEDNLRGFVSITTYDVATDDFLRQAAEKMALKNTQLILGPLFSPSVKSLEKFVKEQNMIMLTLSNNPLLADENNIYVFGHAPLKQTNKMLGYLLAKGHKEFILLLPANKGAMNLGKVLTETIESSGGKVLNTEHYVDNDDSIAEAVSKISENVDEVIEDIDNDIKPVVFLADENNNSLHKIFAYSRKNSLDSKAVIAGDGRIDINFDQPINYLYTGSNAEMDFARLNKIQSIIGVNHLNILENLAYDLGSIVADAVSVSYSKETFLNKIKSPLWYKGLSGEVRFNGALAERKYNIISREGEVYKVLDNSRVPQQE